jgi:hypothetical protein
VRLLEAQRWICVTLPPHLPARMLDCVLDVSSAFSLAIIRRGFVLPLHHVNPVMQSSLWDTYADRGSLDSALGLGDGTAGWRTGRVCWVHACCCFC